VIRTRVGYTGGTTSSPTYHNLGDHTESLQIDFDQTKISYRQLLDIFWSAHDPLVQVWSRQYRAAIFFHDAEQKRQAEASKLNMEQRLQQQVATEILPLHHFYRAEDYHQKYRLQQIPALTTEFSRMYPEFKDFVDSTAAARLNGYLGAHGSLQRLQEEIESYGLSQKAADILIRTLTRGY